MKATKRIAGSLAPFVMGIGLLAACGSNPDEQAEPIAEAPSAGESADESADGPSEPDQTAADPSMDDAVDGDAEAEDAETGVETAETGTDAGDDVNRFAPDAGMADGDLGRFYTTMEIEIDGDPVGTMTFELWPDGAPITVRNHLRLVDEGFYDGLTFHRIIRDFMVQGGDPTGTGTGNSPYGTIQAEFSRDPERSHEYGVLSMARTPAPNSASSQFFIVCDNQNGRQLNGQYATFGRMTRGVETLEAIANVRPTAANGMKPEKRVVIVDAEVVEGDPPGGEEITRPQ